MDAAPGPREHRSGAQINHGHPLHLPFGLGLRAKCRCRRPAREEKKSDPGEAAAVQSETHLKGRGGRGAAAGRDGAPSRAGASDNYPSLTRPPLCPRRYRHLRFSVRKPRLSAASRSYVTTELGFQARLSDPKSLLLTPLTQRRVGNL